MDTPCNVNTFVCFRHWHTSHSPRSWLLEIISIPPMIGHTTMLNLCGFTYGMKGILIAAPASLIASTLVFIALRYFFGDLLRSLSQKNQTWKALEAVVVSILSIPSRDLGRLSFRMPKAFPSSSLSDCLPSCHGCIQTLSLRWVI